MQQLFPQTGGASYALATALIGFLSIGVANASPVYIKFRAPSSLTQGTLINDAGDIAGEYWIGSWSSFVRSPDGTITTFSGDAKATTTEVFGINKNGTVVGCWEDPSMMAHGYVRSWGGHMKAVEIEGAVQTCVFGITDTKDIAGIYAGDDGIYHGFMRTSNGDVTKFDPPNSVNTDVAGITKGSDVFGSYNDASGISHGFFRAPDGTITIIDVSGAKETSVHAMNASGTIAGAYLDQSSIWHFFLRDSNGNITPFDPPSSIGAYQISLNDKNVAAGSFTGIDYLAYGFERFPDGRFRIIKWPPHDRDKLTSTYIWMIDNGGDVVGFHDRRRTPECFGIATVR